MFYIDGQGQVYWVDVTGMVYHVDTSAQQFFHLNNSFDDFKQWFIERPTERLFEFGKKGKSVA